MASNANNTSLAQGTNLIEAQINSLEGMIPVNNPYSAELSQLATKTHALVVATLNNLHELHTRLAVPNSLVACQVVTNGGHVPTTLRTYATEMERLAKYDQNGDLVPACLLYKAEECVRRTQPPTSIFSKAWGVVTSRTAAAAYGAYFVHSVVPKIATAVTPVAVAAACQAGGTLLGWAACNGTLAHS